MHVSSNSPFSLTSFAGSCIETAGNSEFGGLMSGGIVAATALAFGMDEIARQGTIKERLLHTSIGVTSIGCAALQFTASFYERVLKTPCLDTHLDNAYRFIGRFPGDVVSATGAWMKESGGGLAGLLLGGTSLFSAYSVFSTMEGNWFQEDTLGRKSTTQAFKRDIYRIVAGSTLTLCGVMAMKEGIYN